MRRSNHLNFGIIFFVVIAFISMSMGWFDQNQAILSSAGSTQSRLEQNPPYPLRYWVRKLTTPLSTGENLIFKVQYESDGTMPSTIDVYGFSDKVQCVLRDDGVLPDDVAGDKKYAAYKKVDLQAMIKEFKNLEAKIQTDGKVVHFNGHTGEIVSSRELIAFDEDKFSVGDQDVEISAMLIDAQDCQAEIKPEKSLFITDLAVVEDQIRTYNVATGVGNPNGVWTFGKLIANIENGTSTDGVRGFLKTWVKQWTTDQTVNGQLVKARKHVLECVIAPWLRKAQNDPSLDVTLLNWENLWDATNVLSIQQNAPFKLTAIVNRIDVRGNGAYNSAFQNGGETRFIFSLIDPFNGLIPLSPDQPFSAQQNGIGFGDWRGLNVILEYGNVQTSKCDVLGLAQQWLDLSDNSYSFGVAATDNPYKVALQQITDYVTSANSNVAKTNSSAINRIRTNEKALANRDESLEVHQGWARMDWEFRQFELDPNTHVLKLMPLTNNPTVTSNGATNIDQNFSPPQVIVNDNLLNWIYAGNRMKVRHGNYNMPSYLLAGSFVVTGEAAHYFDFDRDNWITKSPEYSTASGGLEEAKEIRQQFSLNTCVGCHNGETKTRFTQINTLAYNETARYWLSTLDGNTILQDNGSYPYGVSLNETEGENQGTTIDNNFSDFQNYTVADEFYKENFFQAVSPFLTGRRYRAFTTESGKSPTWQDDELDDANNFFGFAEELDNSMNGLFYVADPSNMSNGNFPFNDEKKWGYNDLLRRKNGMCNFLVNGCSGINGVPNNPTMMGLIRSIAFIPLPLGGH